MPVEADQLVDNVMREWPATIRIFLDHKMRCVGCPIGCFHTIEDACREHGADCGQFLAELRAAADRTRPDTVTARWPNDAGVENSSDHGTKQQGTASNPQG